ncbi:hypothetical protein Tco_1046656 [Tanacetum coccineum]
MNKMLTSSKVGIVADEAAFISVDADAGGASTTNIGLEVCQGSATASVAAVSTASPTRRVSTADDVTMAETLVYIRKSAAKDKAKHEEEERQRIARVHEAASSFNVEEWEDMQARVKVVEELAQRLQGEEKEMYTEAEQARMLHIGGYTLQQLRGYSFDEIKNLFETTMRRVHTFVPIESEIERIGESSEPAEEPKDKEEELRATTNDDNSSRVELKRLFEPDTDDELWKLQKHIHDITWRLYDTCGVHHVSTKDGVDIYMLVEREYPLSRGVLTQMLVAKLLVEKKNEISRELLRKIFLQIERPRR